MQTVSLKNDSALYVCGSNSRHGRFLRGFEVRVGAFENGDEFLFGFFGRAAFVPVRSAIGVKRLCEKVTPNRMAYESVILRFQFVLDACLKYVDILFAQFETIVQTVRNPCGSEKNSNGNVRNRDDECERIEYRVHKRRNGPVYGPFEWLHVRT